MVKKQRRVIASAPAIDRGAQGPANTARPFGDIQREQRFTYAGYQDAHLIDRMHRCAQLSDRQYEAAQRVLEKHEEAGLEPQTTRRLDPFGSGRGHDDDTEEPAAVAHFRQLLGSCSAAAANILHGMCLEQHPGTMRLATLQAALDDLVRVWRIG